LIVGLAPTLGADEQKSPNAGCTVASLRGSYGFYRFGIGAFGGQLASAGIISFDGSGNWEVSIDVSREGEISLDEPYSGTYTIARNCTGEVFNEFGDPSDRLIVVDDGGGFVGVSVIEGTTLNNIGTRIHDRHTP
jgi:hypothetical protein